MSLQINDNDSLFNAFQLTRDQAVKRLKEHSEDGSGIFINEIKRGKSTYYIQAETTYRGNNFFTRGLSKFFGIKRTEITLQGIDPITKQRFEIAKGTFNNGKGANALINELLTGELAPYFCNTQATSLKNKAASLSQSDPYRDQKVALLNQLSSQFSTIANTIISTAFNKTGNISQLETQAKDIINNLNSLLQENLISSEERINILNNALASLKFIREITPEKKTEYTSDLQRQIDILQTELKNSKEFNELNDSLKNAKTVSEFAKTFSKLKTTNKFIENLQKSKDEKALKKEKDLSPIYSKCRNWAKTFAQAKILSNKATNLSPEERESIKKVCGAVTKELGVAKNTIDPLLSCSEIIRDIDNETNKKPTLANRIINSLNSALELGFITTKERQKILQDALSAIKEGINTEKDPKYSPSPQDMPKFRDHLMKQAKILQDELDKMKESQAQS